MPQNTTRLKVWTVILVVFGLGCVTGASLDSVYRLRASNGSGQEVRGAKTSFFEDVKRELYLDENQATQIGAIVDETRTQYRALKGECQPRYDALRLKARERIRGLLKPEQQERFNALLNQRDARRIQENKE